MSKPRGGKKKFGHKGGPRHFTSFDELKAQQEEVEKARHRDEDEILSRDQNQELRIHDFDKPRKVADAARSDSSSGESEESSDDEDTGKHKGVQHLIEIENPNRRVVKSKKVTDVNVHKGPPEMTRREREAVEKERARQHYLALHAEGKTEEARADLARLALIRKQREEAAKKRQQEQEAKEARKAKGQA